MKELAELLLDKQCLFYREKASVLSSRHILPEMEKFGNTPAHTLQLIELLKNEGLDAVWIPEAYGGKGARLIDSCVITEQLAKACPSSAGFYLAWFLGTAPVMLAGTEEQKRKYLTLCAENQKIITFALTEETAGSDVKAVKAAAAKSAGGWLLNGRKIWNTNCAFAEYTVFFAGSGGGGTSAFIVPFNSEGLSFSAELEKMGLCGTSVANIEFNNVKIPHSLLIGTEGTGLKTALSSLTYSRILTAAQAAGTAQRALDIALDFVKNRQQFGQAAAAFQGIRWKLAELQAEMESVRCLVYETALAADKISEKELRSYSSMAKYTASNFAVKAASEALTLCGGRGYMKASGIEMLYRDAKITQIYEGINTIQLEIIASGLFSQ
jgi:alkylation response protein AidB-like acyl-CoA dehydrogenase